VQTVELYTVTGMIAASEVQACWLLHM